MLKNFSIEAKMTKTGLKLKTPRGDYSLVYPRQIWAGYPEDLKSTLCDNLSFLLTSTLPLVAGIKKIEYNTSMPFFMPFFFQIISQSIPSAIEDYPPATSKILKQFLNTKFSFKEDLIKVPRCERKSNFKEKAIVPLSFGKDSLLTLALARELGLEPVAVYINDTVSPSENKIKLKMAKRISKELNVKIHIIENQIEKLNDFYLWDKDESCVGYMHMLTGFCFMLLPFVNFYKAKYVLVGNQQDMNFPFENKDGYHTYPSPDQRPVWTKFKSAAVSLMTGGETRVLSLIEPLTNIAIVKLLHTRFSEFAKYQVSCDCLDASEEDRWCCNCSKCARLTIFKKAFGVDVKTVGLKDKLLNKKYARLYTLFDGPDVDMYEKSPQSKKQQLLAFYLAYKRGVKGGLIDKFKEEYLPLSERKINSLQEEFFNIYDTDLPPDIKEKFLPLLRKIL